MSHAARSRSSPADADPGTVAGLVTMLTLGVAFGLGALGVDWFWIAFPLGFGGVMPVAVGAARRRQDDRGERRDERRDAGVGRRAPERPGTDTDAALARLRERYATGELDEVAFERRLERLLRTEDETAAREYLADAGRARPTEEVPPERARQNPGGGATPSASTTRSR
jgi:uncharacterized membrane protein